ncbi:MAG TPA: ATP12 family protein [Pseudolabrys sp.]|nr:ATP12 family protein [Pseudolabrys sp.]
MRDIFEDIFASQPLDPMESARRNMRPLRKRFYTDATVGPDHAVLLDGRPVRTPARRPLIAPDAAIAQMVVDEWRAQGEDIDPATMPMTRLANSIIDAVVDHPQPVAEEIAGYLGSDLVCYRAGEPDSLVAWQAQHWDPVLEFARQALDARFVLAQGVVFQQQPAEALVAARRAIPFDPWRLGALSSMTTLTGSALIALAYAHGALTLENAWAAAHADEDFQMRQWGRDELALKRRAYRFAEMQAAAAVLAHLPRGG